MSIQNYPIYDKDALLSAVEKPDLPLAFIVGSPLSRDSSGGVPNISEFVNIIRHEVESTRPSKLASFDSTIDKTSEVIAYQHAMHWLQGYCGPKAISRVVSNAVKRCRKPSAPTAFDDDGSPENWHIPKGTRELAKLVTSGDERFAGPILTTNFDPLIPLAIKEACGVEPPIRVVDTDGYLQRQVEAQRGLPHVIYLHGYWRLSATLHTQVQLTNPRPKLISSLQELLSGRTVFVVAYGGWDDAFMHALEGILERDTVTFNIVWCFYEKDRALIESRYASLFQRMRHAIIKARFSAYMDVDCHSIFGELAGNAGLPSLQRGPLLELSRMYRNVVRTWIGWLVHATQESNREAIVELLKEEMATTPELLTEKTRPELVSYLCDLEPEKVVFFADLLLDISADVAEKKWLRFWKAYIMTMHRLVARYRDMDIMLQLNNPVARWIDSAPDARTKDKRELLYKTSDNTDGR